jgi:5'-deoxynucleotidase
MPHHFFAFISRMKYINRWGLMRNTRNENISEHSLEVAIITHALCVIAHTYFNASLDQNKAALIAIYHDANEIITGDIPTPIKYFNPYINKAYKEIEDISKRKLLSLLRVEMVGAYDELLFSNYDKELELRVKWADKICAYIKCIEERKAGNTEFKLAEQNILNQLLKIEAPEVKYFLNEFMDSFQLSIDEQD